MKLHKRRTCGTNRHQFKQHRDIVPVTGGPVAEQKAKIASVLKRKKRRRKAKKAAAKSTRRNI